MTLGAIYNLDTYFQIGPNLKEMCEITVPQFIKRTCFAFGNTY